VTEATTIPASDDSHAVLPQAARHTAHPDAQWFPEAGLGLFIHWGISSVHGGIDLSWGMIKNKPWDPMGREITPEEYYQLAERFDPQQYDPDKWLRAAKAAGFRYAVLTTKHHDGYALWPSEYATTGVKQYLGGRDLVQPFVDACRKNGLRIGFYFSPRDWHYPGFLMPFPDFDRARQGEVPIPDPEQNQRDFEPFYEYTKGQVEELLTRYGKIDILWFDGIGWPGVTDIHNEDMFALIHRLQPGIVVNNRWHNMGGERTGDFETPECRLPNERPQGWWEAVDVWPFGNWGYSTSHEYYKSLGWMLSRLAVCRGWGGNLMVNVGPRPTGELPDACYRRFEELAAWMQHSGEAIFGVQPGPYPRQSNVPVTVRGNRWYLHYASGFDKQITLREVAAPRSVTLLRTGEGLPVERGRDCVQIIVPSEVRTCDVDVVAVDW